jgi:CRAL/TRIO domain
LPNTATPDGSRLVILRPSAYDPEKYRMEDIVRVGLMIAEMMMQDDDNFVVAGQVAVCDVKGLSMGHIAQATTTMMRKISMITIDASPYRTQTVHYINLPAAFNYIFGFAKNFFGEAKLNLYVHDSLESLYEHIPRHCLPTEYGGDAGSLAAINEQLEIKLQSYSEYFKRTDAYGVQENKRPGKPKNAEQLFGTDGTFRTLSID